MTTSASPTVNQNDHLADFLAGLAKTVHGMSWQDIPMNSVTGGTGSEPFYPKSVSRPR